MYCPEYFLGIIMQVFIPYPSVEAAFHSCALCVTEPKSLILMLNTSQGYQTNYST